MTEREEIERKEIYALHDNIKIPAGYMARPKMHMQNFRDKAHIEHTMGLIKEDKFVTTMLDIGAWDGWLGFYVAEHSMISEVCFVEFIADLAQSIRNYIDKNYSNEKYILNKNFNVIEGSWLDKHVDPCKKYDLVTAYEVMEHIFLKDVCDFIEKLEKHSNKYITISLPDQTQADNPQHQWSPSWMLIDSLFRNKKDLDIKYQEYPGTEIPANWFITYTI